MYTFGNAGPGLAFDREMLSTSNSDHTLTEQLADLRLGEKPPESIKWVICLERGH
jgi:hypothetical protein